MRPKQGGMSTMRPRADSRLMVRGDSPLWLSFAVSGFSIVAARGFAGTGRDLSLWRRRRNERGERFPNRPYGEPAEVARLSGFRLPPE